MTDTETDYTDQIAAGMAWLDANQPGWVQVFAEDQAAGLHMEDCTRCVLGHVLGNYWDVRSPIYIGVADPIRLEDEDESVLEANSVAMGFTLPDSDSGDSEYHRLGSAWREAIGKRLAEQGMLA